MKRKYILWIVIGIYIVGLCAVYWGSLKYVNNKDWKLFSEARQSFNAVFKEYGRNVNAGYNRAFIAQIYDYRLNRKKRFKESLALHLSYKNALGKEYNNEFGDFFKPIPIPFYLDSGLEEGLGFHERKQMINPHLDWYKEVKTLFSIDEGEKTDPFLSYYFLSVLQQDRDGGAYEYDVIPYQIGFKNNFYSRYNYAFVELDASYNTIKQYFSAHESVHGNPGNLLREIENEYYWVVNVMSNEGTIDYDIKCYDNWTPPLYGPNWLMIYDSNVKNVYNSCSGYYGKNVGVAANVYFYSKPSSYLTICYKSREDIKTKDRLNFIYWGFGILSAFFVAFILLYVKLNHKKEENLIEEDELKNVIDKTDC